MEISGIVQSIYRWEDKKFIFGNVVTELIAEESRLKQRQSDLDFIALESKLDRTLPEKDKLNKFVSNKCKKDIAKVRTCFGCGKHGHVIANCRIKFKSNMSKEVKHNCENSFILKDCFNPLIGSVFFLKRFEKRAAAEPLSILKMSSSQQKIFPKEQQIKSLPPSELWIVSNPLGGAD
ncbi:hypothetical protein AVEN_168790-1 [Araneus ventricosus]|uniref:CCHC-type domain-containing protein n=1 Tax=Araneus ventricosus TaxID=182803 RepID=A0A4Y2K6A3_ARAVE|nr:hypothetical protein AVEN_168790-1 [Araneus ventricosus]